MIVATVRCLLTLLSFICLFGSFGADDGNKLQSDTQLLIDSHQGLRTSSWRNSTEHTVICKRNWSPRINGYVTCCQIPAEGVIKCLPSLIIAGVQKGGTTALSALLCFIRGISFSKKKEIHYFDNVRKYSIGISEYLHYFNQWNLTDIDQAYPLAYAESTPFYLASRQACERIYKTIPDVKIVVLLREPVSRAYSEYQMKKRRVDSQDEFVALLTKHVQHLNRCLAIYPIMWDALAACLPTEITDHSHYQKLISSLKNQRFHQLKIRVESEISSGVCIIASRSSSTGVRRNFSELRDKVTQYGEDGIRCKEECIEGTVKMKRRKRIQKSGKINATRNIIHRKEQSRRDGGNFRRGFPFIQKAQIRSILGKYAAERLPPLDESFQGELREWERCAGSLIGPGMTVESLDTAVVKCLERGRGIRMGIGRLYFYRSLYAVQLHNCFKHIPREQFLIISTEQLRRDPVRTLNQVLQFTGLNLQFELGGVFNMLSPWNSRSHSFKSRNIRDQFSMEMMEGKWTEEISADEFHRQSAFIGAAVDKFFPTFGSSSGWQLHSAYSPLPSNLQAELTHFFKPYNNLLSKLLNTDYFDQEWADRGIGGGHNTSMVK